MKLTYDPATDSLYIDLSSRTSTESVEAANGVVIDLDGQGSVVGIDIDHASEKVDLSFVEVDSLPVRKK